MKSRASREGNKSVNPVHKNSVHLENLRKEMKYYDKNRMDHF